MNNFYRKLNLPINPLVDEYDLKSQKLPHVRIDTKFLNPQLEKVFSDLGISVRIMESFKRLPGRNSTIHSDSNLDGEFVKINWIFGGADSTMSWFESKDSSFGQHNVSLANTKYTLYTEDEVNLVETIHTEDNTPYLVQVGVPHQVLNPKETRFCVCCGLFVPDGIRLTFEECLTKLSDYILVETEGVEPF